MFKTVFASMLLATTVYAGVNQDDLMKSTVMITNKESSSGGTGVILKSKSDKSTILTNGHVCDVVKNGGLVHSYKGRVSVERYTKSNQHDLCLIEVMADLDVNTPVARKAPKLMEKTFVAGHPYLFPATVSEGHFSNSMIIQIILGVKECTKEDQKNNGFLCFLFGGMPMVRELNTNTVSNLIAPGNSGSAVYNNYGEIIGLIFAGAGRGMSPGIIVPYEYIRSFIDSELKGAKLKVVETAVSKKLTELSSETKYETEGRSITKLTNLVFAAIKSETLDKIENKLRTCTKTEEYGCLNLAK